MVPLLFILLGVTPSISLPTPEASVGLACCCKISPTSLSAAPPISGWGVLCAAAVSAVFAA